MINLNNRVFKALVNSDNGEVNESTLFSYYQDKNMIWADYSGGEILKGHLLGKQVASSKFEFFYHHLNMYEEMKVGKCTSEAILADDGRVKLLEKWQWLCDDMSSGTSELIEIE